MKTISVIMSAIISSMLLVISEYFSFSTVAERADYYEYYSPFGSFLLYTAFQVPFYIILGIPVTYLIDFICKKIVVKNIVKLYFVRLFLFTLVAFLLPTVARGEIAIETIVYFGLIPVLTYFHVLLFVRKYLNCKREKPQYLLLKKH
ncbi:hypothetical protein [Fictibacillus arsenicus]|uniref:Uncharacterized protein n=1 Tax=Fictibacillus arsenicus TaxID=255247 RepID=A0A1V3G840_9BACL|nr:hypothetical protein [Fictibacillus arsenicus]OOE12569.1 hypothetical protein UN64_10870 [Fictibacillus arsenicus]